MSFDWGDLNARARGWATHLLGRSELQQLARMEGIGALADEFARRGWIRGDNPAPATAALLEAAVRRLTGSRLAALARWAGPRSRAFPMLFEQVERQSLRSLVRGAAAGFSSERRLAGTLPTPALPTRALVELASQPRVADIASLLTLWQHPYAAVVAAAGRANEPDLLHFELALAHRFALRAHEQVTALEPRLLEDVRLSIDLENLSAALLLSVESADIRPEAAFLPFGQELSLAQFETAIRSGSAAKAVTALRKPLSGTTLGRLLADHGSDREALETAGLALRLQRARGTALRDPLSPSPTLAYGLAVLAEQMALFRIIWTLALVGPPAEIALELAGRP
ncbi:MAG: V-type ATPase subunit [Gemmatimonadota bacterium]